MSRFKGVKGTIILMIIIALIVSYYFYLSNKTTSEKDEPAKITAVQSILLDNIDVLYPPSPKEVLKYYCEITKCFYNEEYSEEELNALALKIREIYDDELVSNQSEEQYLTDLKADIQSFRDMNCTISSYSTSSSMEVEYFSVDEFEFAKLYCVFTLRQGTELQFSTEQFLLRKDDEGHWRIYGWELADKSENE